MIAAILTVPVGGLLWIFSGTFNQDHAATPAQTQPNANSAIAGNGSPAIPSVATATANGAPAVTETPIDRARGLAKSKDYAKAEEQYRAILKGDPKNREVVLGLADVLYRQQKFEESAAVLKALSRNNP